MLTDGAWNCQPAFLVAGGPSLKDLDWGLLRGVRNVVCVNRSFLDVPTASAFFTEDLRFVEKYADKLREFKGEAIFHALAPEHIAPALAAVPNLRIIERKRLDKFWSQSFADGLSYSSNSAIGALNVLSILGAEPIYLLGVDCNPKEPTNYHDDYAQDWRSCADQMRSFASDFEHWAKPSLRGRTVVNLNPTSGVTCWTRSRVGYNEALAHLVCAGVN